MKKIQIWFCLKEKNLDLCFMLRLFRCKILLEKYFSILQYLFCSKIFSQKWNIFNQPNQTKNLCFTLKILVKHFTFSLLPLYLILSLPHASSPLSFCSPSLMTSIHSHSKVLPSLSSFLSGSPLGLLLVSGKAVGSVDRQSGSAVRQYKLSISIGDETV